MYEISCILSDGLGTLKMAWKFRVREQYAFKWVIEGNAGALGNEKCLEYCIYAGRNLKI